MTIRLTAMLCASASLLALTGIQPAVAQSDQQTASTGGLEEIVVTARRREERIQTVPIAITAFTGADIEKKSIHEMHDLAINVPSVGSSESQSDSNGVYGSQFRLRGLPGTVIYLNDVPIGSGDFQPGTGIAHGLSEGYLFDLEDLEVVKGPQGTLFGKNSVGGLVSIKSKRPTSDYEGYAKVTFGNYGDKEFEAAVNIPIISDKLMVRIAGTGQQRDGYTKDLFSGKDLDNKNYQSWRVSILARPTDDIENYFTYDGYWQDTNGSSEIVRAYNPSFALTNLKTVFASSPAGLGALNAFGISNTPVTLGTGPNLLGFFSPATFVSTALAAKAAGGVSLYPNSSASFAEQQGLGPRAEVGNNFQGIGKDYFYGFTNATTWDVTDNLTLKNIAAARIFKTLATVDYSPIGVPILNIGIPGNNQEWGENAVQYTEELQLQGKALGDKLDYVLGGFLEFDHPLGSTTLGSANLGNTIFGGVTYNHYNTTARSQAAFATASYDFSDYVDGLKLTGGYRYTFDFSEVEVQSDTNVDQIQRNADGSLANCPSFNHDNNCFQSLSKHFSSYGWNVALNEQLDQNTLIYIRSGNAYRPGGFNTTVPNQFATFGPEHITDVEGGAKLTFDIMGMNARTNFDGFHSEYKAIQVQSLVSFTDPNGGNHTNSLYQNAATATINGGEFEGTLIPVKGVELSAHASYIDAKYGSYPAVFGGGGASSVAFLYFPRFSWGADATYHLPIDESYGDVALTAVWSHYGHQIDSVSIPEAIATTPAHDLLNLRIDWTNIFGQPIDAGFFMNNALDTTYIAGVIPIYAQLGFSSVSYGAPRMFGFSLKYRFSEGDETATAAAAYTPPPAVAPAPAMAKSYLVFFDFNKSDLTPQAASIVDQAAANAGPAKVTKLEVTGHTDTVGSDAYNMRLSRRRAESVAAQLEKDGIPASEIAIFAKGKRDLLVPTADGVKEPQNRRVQIVYEGGPTS
jgi:iron complex outermembrane receptor protein